MPSASLGIPKQFRPGVDMQWYGRGENALAKRRAELRALVNAQIEAKKRALERIEITLNAAREQVIISGLGNQAIEMLNELPTLEVMMPTLAIDAMENDLLTMRDRCLHKLLGGDYYRYSLNSADCGMRYSAHPPYQANAGSPNVLVLPFA